MKHSLLFRTISALVLMVPVVAACGGGGGTPGSSDTVTSLPGSSEISTLTPAEKQNFCEDTRAYVRRVDPEKARRLSCALGALVSAAIAGALNQDRLGACKKSYDECLTKKSEPDPSSDAGTSEEKASSDCNILKCKGISVDEYSTCIKDLVAAYNTFSFSCEDAVTRDAGAATSQSTPACDKVKTACK